MAKDQEQGTAVNSETCNRFGKIICCQTGSRRTSFSPDTEWQRQFEDIFPYQETPDQVQAIEEIKRDMESSKVMDRLLCGDVDTGRPRWQSGQL